MALGGIQMIFYHSSIWFLLTVVPIAFLFLLYKNIFYTINNKNVLNWIIEQQQFIHHISVLLNDSLYCPINWAFLDCSHKGGIDHCLMSPERAIWFSRSLSLNSLKLWAEVTSFWYFFSVCSRIEIQQNWKVGEVNL